MLGMKQGCSFLEHIRFIEGAPMVAAICYDCRHHIETCVTIHVHLRNWGGEGSLGRGAFPWATYM